MSTDSTLNNVPPPDDALAALMAAPEFRAQMAALTQQAVASLQAMVAALRAAEAQLAANPPLPKPIVDIPYGLAVEPALLPWIDTPSSDPVALGGLGAGVKLMLPDGGAVMGAPVFSMEPMLRPDMALAPEELAVDMLAMLPQPAAAIAVAAPSLPAGGGGTDVALMLFAVASESRSGAEGSTD